MKYPLDKICIKSGVFCPSCQRKIESGVVTSSDIRILQALVNLEDKLKFLKKGEYVKSIDLGEYVVVLIKDGFEQVEIATLGKELSDAIGKRVKVIEYMSDLKKLIEQIIAPASLLGINKIWLPTGEEIVSVRISRRDRRFIAKNKDEYEELIEKISGIKARIVFE
ncbi:MAG: transcription elongation factor [Desulfurococcaceae archaeon]